MIHWQWLIEPINHNLWIVVVTVRFRTAETNQSSPRIAVSQGQVRKEAFLARLNKSQVSQNEKLNLSTINLPTALHSMFACPPCSFCWSSTSRQRFAGNSLESAASSRESPRRTALQCVNATPMHHLHHYQQERVRHASNLIRVLAIFAGKIRFNPNLPAMPGLVDLSTLRHLPKKTPCAPRSRGLYRSFQRSLEVFELQTRVQRVVSRLMVFGLSRVQVTAEESDSTAQTAQPGLRISDVQKNWHILTHYWHYIR